jgi:hypothetical protein
MRLLTYSFAKKSLRYLLPAVLVVLSSGTGFISTASAQAPPPPLPLPGLDGLVQRIALCPDPLLAQILAAATHPNDIPAAA